MRQRLINILFWSVISAAFIGPGTITTASKAGAEFGFDLLWALVFSVIACLVLQEAVARVTIQSGINLGQAIRNHYQGRSSFALVLVLVIGAIIIGSAAYETGNLLGAVAGLEILFPVKTHILVLLIGFFAVLALSLPSLRNIARLMGFVVAIMGISFFTTAILLKPDIGEIIKGSLPSLPGTSGAGLLVLGLIGTTVVPYNLFLGSGIAQESQSVKEMRFGLSIAVIFGGLISMSVLVVGSFVSGTFSYEALVNTLDKELGSWIVVVFAIGMFAAGITSAITAPLASAITARSLFSGDHPEKWSHRSINFIACWGIVLLTGIILGMLGFKPIPAIILAQALNGLILPFISIFLVFVINNPKIMGQNNMNGTFSNLLMLAIVWVSIVLGIMNLSNAMIQVFPVVENSQEILFIANFGLSSLIWAYVVFQVIQIRKSGHQ